MNYSCNLYWQLNGYIYDLAKNNHKDSYLTHLIKVCEKEINNTIFNSEFINMYQDYSSFCVSSDEYLTLFLFIKYFGLQLNNLSPKSIYYLIQVLVIEKINPEFIKRNIAKFLDSYVSTLTNELSEIEERENILISLYELIVNEDINIAIVLCRLLGKAYSPLFHNDFSLENIKNVLTDLLTTYSIHFGEEDFNLINSLKEENLSFHVIQKLNEAESNYEYIIPCLKKILTIFKHAKNDNKIIVLKKSRI